VSGFSRPCRACGRVAAPGATLCPSCASGAGKRLSSCRVCGARTDGSPYCPEHIASAATIRRRERPHERRYTRQQYLVNRRLRWERSHHRCEECEAPLEGRPWECDHDLAVIDGGTDDVENLRVHCPECHHKKTAADRRRRKQEGR
jgi:5-methylcytosine-specific restriction endonuclease McrA